MLILLSSARTMDFNREIPFIPMTQSLYQHEAEFLAKKMKDLSIDEIQKKLHVSEAIAQKTVYQYQHFMDKDIPVRQAIFAYHGSVFKKMNPDTLSQENLLYMQDHLRIASTLFGMVRPFDGVKAYRMTFNLTLANIGATNIQNYWKPRLTAQLIQDIKQAGGILVNLASLDIQNILDMPYIASSVRVVTPDFKEFKNGKYETIRTYAKIARGLMSRMIIEEQIEDPTLLKKFTLEGFCYNESLSDTGNYVYIR